MENKLVYVGKTKNIYALDNGNYLYNQLHIYNLLYDMQNRYASSQGFSFPLEIPPFVNKISLNEPIIDLLFQ